MAGGVVKVKRVGKYVFNDGKGLQGVVRQLLNMPCFLCSQLQLRFTISWGKIIQVPSSPTYMKY